MRMHGCFLFLLSAVAQSATFNVNSLLDVEDVNWGDGVCETAKDTGTCTLRAAIEEANALDGADTVILQGLTYFLVRSGVDDAGRNGDLDILDDVTIVGAGPGSTIIDGNSALTLDRVFEVSKCKGNPLLVDCDALHPPVVASISGVTIEHGNASQDNGGGGGILNRGSLTLTNCVVTNNKASGASALGGGILNAGSLSIFNSTISNNVADPKVVFVTNSSYGGGIYSNSSIAISGSTISANSAKGDSGFGGGLAINSVAPATIDNSAISGNTAFGTGKGGGLWGAGTVTMSNTTISGNTAGSDGGGLWTAAGGVLPSVLRVSNSTISGNVSHHFGGGAFFVNGTFINSTVSGNFSDDDGGGLYAMSGTTQLYHVTVTQNLANADDTGTAVAGGVFNASSGPLFSANSIIALNETSLPTVPFPTIDTDDCAGNIASLGKTIIYEFKPVHCSIGGTYLLADPMLGPLQYNGGPTQTHALLDGSPAIDPIDAGVTAACIDDQGHPLTRDQRGALRPWGAQCDIGAYEWRLDIIFQDGFQ